MEVSERSVVLLCDDIKFKCIRAHVETSVAHACDALKPLKLLKFYGTASASIFHQVTTALIAFPQTSPRSHTLQTTSRFSQKYAMTFKLLTGKCDGFITESIFCTWN